MERGGRTRSQKETKEQVEEGKIKDNKEERVLGE